MPVLLFSVIAHEYAHGYAALKQGDTTALMLGRLTWNPVKHIDPFMTVILPALLYLTMGIMLGGAKPVPVNPANYRNYRRGDIIVSLAGVFVNFLLALIAVLLFVGVGFIGRAAPGVESFLGVVQAMMFIGVQLNLLLLAFNLIPIPPLDGSHVVKHFMPAKAAYYFQRFGRYGLLILILLLYTNSGFFSVWMKPVVEFQRMLFRLVGPYAVPSFGEWLR